MNTNSNPNNSILLKLLIGILILISTLTLFLIYKTLQNNTNSSISNTPQTTFAEDLSQVDPSDKINHAENISVDTNVHLSQIEIDDLKKMREEEKLAHDVYITLYEKWGLNIFNNISSSEQKHTDSIKTLLNKYNISDPALEKLGIFTNQDLQKLYDDLVTKGSVSITEALKIGALIEDLDIHDLDMAKSETTNPDILQVYNNLQKGSRNHIRSFTSTLSRYGITYEPSYISKDLYINIISSAQEKGNNNGKGKN